MKGRILSFKTPGFYKTKGFKHGGTCDIDLNLKNLQIKAKHQNRSWDD